MPRPKSAVPSYRLHKASGQAVAYVNRQYVYLGPYNSPESHREYAEMLARLAAAADAGPILPAQSRAGLPVSELCLKFVVEELPRFSVAERHCQQAAIRVLRQLFGASPASQFGPLRLRTVRDAMVAGDRTLKPPRKPWSRRTVNRQVKRIQALFRWAAEWELVPIGVYQALSAVRILKPGETSAREAVPRQAVPAASIEAVRKVLKPHHRDVFDLLLLTGARSGELLGLTGELLDRSGDTWRADLSEHKTAHKGKRRVLFFNRSAQAILLRHLKPNPAEKLFGIRRDNFAKVISRACERAKVDHFCPHMLRHTVSTSLVDSVGIEGAQRVLGHSSAAMTEHYSRVAERQAVEAVQKLG
jgi:integrase